MGFALQQIRVRNLDILPVSDNTTVNRYDATVDRRNYGIMSLLLMQSDITLM